MSIAGLKERMSELTFVCSYYFNYNNVSSNIIPDTIFTVKLYADKKSEKAPLFVVSEPKAKHYHIVQNASENLARIIFAIEEKHIKNTNNADNFIAKQNFQAELLKELLNHAPILPAKEHLNTIESSVMMLGFLYESFKYFSELYENNKHAKHLCSLLSESLFAEHTRHENGLELVSLIHYSQSQRTQVMEDCSPHDFQNQFGISII